LHTAEVAVCRYILSISRDKGIAEIGLAITPP
jgi:hypothetical protein